MKENIKAYLDKLRTLLKKIEEWQLTQISKEETSMLMY